MPFDQPPMPSSFNVGNPSAGHMHFDASGTVWFGPDGVTEQLRFDTATGTLFFGGLIAFPTHTAWETQAAEIQAVPNNSTHENTMVVQSPSVDVADDVSALLLHSGINGVKAPWLELQANGGSISYDGTQLAMNGSLIKGWFANPGIVAASETTASAAFTDLATVGPQVAVDIGPSGLALCMFGAQMQAASGGVAVMGIATSGANSTPASDGFSVVCSGPNDTQSAPILATGLTPGVTTFTAKYRSTSGTAGFLRRSLTVIPL